MCNCPKHLNHDDFHFLADVGRSSNRKLMALEDAIDHHADTAADLDLGTTASLDDIRDDDEDDPAADDASRRTIRAKTRELQRRSRAIDYRHVQRTVASKQRAEERRRTG